MTTTSVSAPSAALPLPAFAPSLTRLHAAAVVRILFGCVWTIDAIFKFLPGFVHGQTLGDELGAGAKVHTPVIHQWIQLWFHIGTAHPGTFAVCIGIIESCIAIGLLTGAFSNLVLIGSAIFSFGIWSAAEGFHLPWSKPGITDLGPSVGYIFASLGLYLACAGATWSLDHWIRPRLGRLAPLASRTV